jgi:hypothetical protein
MKRSLFFGLISIFTSCSYSTRYIATYTIQKSSTKDKEIATSFIQTLADRNELYKDPKYFGTDTIGYFGKPYHYFKFCVGQKDSLTFINLNYSGTTIGSRKPPYRDFIDNFNDSIQIIFKVKSFDIKETDNQRQRK